MQRLPSIIITGASGLIGKNLIENLREKYIIYAIARRSRNEAGITYHPNLKWIQCDIGNAGTLLNCFQYIKQDGKVDFIIHLAAYYDFTYKYSPEYQRTNVEGTRNILHLTQKLFNTKRFIYASSLAACNFPNNDGYISESSPPDAHFYYAQSKAKAEALIKEYSQYFPASIIRLAAVYSDWCEYAPLYKFISNWLSHKIDSRILAGKGESAVPYIHVHDVFEMLNTIINKTGELPQYDIYNASPNGSTSHKKLFRITTLYHFGESVKPVFIPKLLAYPGLFIKRALSRIGFFCTEPFERLWMVKYIDKKLNADSTYTFNKLDWKPTPRYHIERRLLFLLEKMKSYPDEWKMRNEAALKRVERRANLIIYENMISEKNDLIDTITSEIQSQERKKEFANYHKMPKNDLKCYLSTLYHLLMASVRSGERSLMLQYVDDIAIRRFAEGFTPQEINSVLSVYKDVIVNSLLENKNTSKIKQEVYDYIAMTIQLAQDEIEDLYDSLTAKLPKEKLVSSELLPDCKKLQKMIKQLSAFYQIYPEDENLFNENEDYETAVNRYLINNLK